MYVSDFIADTKCVKANLAVVSGSKKAPTRAQLIDEYGELDRQVRQFKPRMDRYEELKKLIKGWYENSPPDETAVAVGLAYEIQVSARANESYLAQPMLVYKAFGSLPKFLEFVKRLITKAALADALGSEKKAEAFFDQNQTGSRRLTAVFRGGLGNLRPAA